MLLMFCPHRELHRFQVVIRSSGSWITLSGLSEYLPWVCVSVNVARLWALDEYWLIGEYGCHSLWWNSYLTMPAVLSDTIWGAVTAFRKFLMWRYDRMFLWIDLTLMVFTRLYCQSSYERACFRSGYVLSSFRYPGQWYHDMYCMSGLLRHHLDKSAGTVPVKLCQK